MPRTITCFVSFSAPTAQADIRFFLKYLATRLSDKVIFKAFFDIRSGTDLQDFMREDLAKADAVLALFTPDYKMKADQAIRSGVHTEFLHIVDRLEGRLSHPMRLIPIYWGGPSFESAVPKFFLNHNMTRDLQEFHAYGTNGEPFLPVRVEKALRSVIDLIIEDLNLRWMEVTPSLLRLGLKSITRSWRRAKPTAMATTTTTFAMQTEFCSRRRSVHPCRWQNSATNYS